MSAAFDFDAIETAEPILSPEEMCRLGLEASTPGLGEETDLVTAHKWFNLAALGGNAVAREYRQQLTLEMSPREIAEAQRQAREWLQERRPFAQAS